MCIEKLKYSLEQKKPTLLLGAGFTLGAKSKNMEMCLQQMDWQNVCTSIVLLNVNY